MDKTHWNNFIRTNGPLSGSFLQSYEWGEFQESLGRKVIRVMENDFAAQVIKIPLGFGLNYLYVPKGPIIKKVLSPAFSPSPREGEIKREWKSEIIKLAKKERAVFIRFEPPHQFFNLWGDKPEFLDEKDIADWGIEKSPARQVQPNQTLILNLEKPFDDLLRQMHPKTRYNINLAERHGVEIGVGNGFGEFLRLLKETAERDKFHLHPIGYYKKMAEFFSHPHPSSPYSDRGVGTGGDRGGLKIKLWTAKYKNSNRAVGSTSQIGQTVAANLIGYFGDTATYLHGASSYNWHNLMAPHLLHWQIIKNAKLDGYKFYDFWGIDEIKWPGVTRFKKGFGGEEISSPGTFDLPIKKNWYKMYRLVRKVISYKL